MASPYSRKFSRIRKMEQELFEPIYTIELVRKWKLEKLNKIMKGKIKR